MGWSPLPKTASECQSGECKFPLMREATTMKATTIGIDLAKHLFQLHGVDQHGKTVLKRQLKRVASIGNAKNFKNGRQLAAWLGLVPRQHSSGGKQNLLGISKRGDSYLRTLLIHGARAVLRVAERKESFSGSGLAGVMARRNPNVAAVAQANKTARIICALLAHDRKYDAHYGMAA